MKNKHLPEGWKEAELKDVCIIIMGQSPPGNSYNDKHNGTPFFQGKSEFGKRYPRKIEDHDVIRRRKYQKKWHL